MPRPPIDPPPLIIWFLGEKSSPVEVSISDACDGSEVERREIERSWRSAVRRSVCCGCILWAVCALDDDDRLSGLQFEVIELTSSIEHLSASSSWLLDDAVSLLLLLFNLWQLCDSVIGSPPTFREQNAPMLFDECTLWRCVRPSWLCVDSAKAAAVQSIPKYSELHEQRTSSNITVGCRIICSNAVMMYFLHSFRVLVGETQWFVADGCCRRRYQQVYGLSMIPCVTSSINNYCLLLDRGAAEASSWRDRQVGLYRRNTS